MLSLAKGKPVLIIMFSSICYVTGDDKFVSKAGTSRTANQWFGDRHDKKERQRLYEDEHGKKPPSREEQFGEALTLFLHNNVEDLVASGFERDLFSMILDTNHLEEYCKEYVDFENDGFLHMVPLRACFSCSS